MSGKLQTSQFAGLSLSPDGNRLYIADSGADMIHMLELTTPGNGYSINVATALGQSSILAPTRVFELSTEKLFGEVLGNDLDQHGTLFQIDPNTGVGAWASNPSGPSEYVWNTTNSGAYALIEGATIGLWNAGSSVYLTSAGEAQGLEEAANEDGTAIVVGGSTPGLIDGNPEILDFNLNSIGYIEQHFDVPMPIGTPSFFLHPTGALLYKAGNNSGGLAGVFQTEQWRSTICTASNPVHR